MIPIVVLVSDLNKRLKITEDALQDEATKRGMAEGERDREIQRADALEYKLNLAHDEIKSLEALLEGERQKIAGLLAQVVRLSNWIGLFIGCFNHYRNDTNPTYSAAVILTGQQLKDLREIAQNAE